MEETSETGIALTITGGVLTGIASISTATFGLVPTFLLGLGGILIGVGIYKDFRNHATTIATKPA